MIIGGISGEPPGYDVQDKLEIWYPCTRESHYIEEGSIDRKGAAMCGNLLCGGHQGRHTRDIVSEGSLSRGQRFKHHFLKKLNHPNRRHLDFYNITQAL